MKTKSTLVVLAIGAALVAGVVTGTLFPILGIPDAYAVALLSGVGSLVLAFFVFLSTDAFDDAGYESLGRSRTIVDSVLVAACGTVVAAAVVFVLLRLGYGPLTASLDGVAVSGRHVLSTATGVAAGIGLFYARNRRFVATD